MDAITTGPLHRRTVGVWSTLHKATEAFAIKDVFDNVRNYGIAAGVYVVAAKVGKTGSFPPKFLAAVLFAVAFCLAALCFMQSIVLTIKMVHAVFKPTASDQYQLTMRGRMVLLLGLALPVLWLCAVAAAALAYA